YFATTWWRAGTVVVTYFSFIFGVLPSILVCALGFKLPNTLLANGPLLYLGRISYSVYMVHAVIQVALIGAFRALAVALPVGSLAFAALYAAGVIAVATASYCWLEVPAQRFLRASDARSRCTQIAHTGSRIVQPGHQTVIGHFRVD